MPARPAQIPLKGLSLTIYNHAKHAMRVLGSGHSERIYHRALATSLARAHIQYRSEVVTPIVFMGECVGFGRADLVVTHDGETVVVECKANARAPASASGQLKKYMESLRGVEAQNCAGLVINFNQASNCVETLVAPLVRKSRFFS